VFERFTDRARRVVVLAQEESRLLNHNYIGTEHLLLGLIHESDGIGAKVLQSLGISLNAVRSQVEEILGPGGHPASGHIPFTDRAKKALESSLREALQLGHNYIGTEHILLGLIRDSDGVAAQVLGRLGADPSLVRQHVVGVLEGNPGSVRLEAWAATDVSRLGVAPSVTALPQCGFCGRDLWEAEHFVAGERAAICDTCVTAAHVAIGEAASDAHAASLPVRVYGDEPSAGTTAIIVRAVARTFGSLDAHEMTTDVEEGASLLQAVEQALKSRPIPSSGFGVRVDRVRYLGPDSAAVRFAHVNGGITVRSNEARMVRSEGRWLVAAASFIQLAGIAPLPPNP
jgi:hypothetical protein